MPKYYPNHIEISVDQVLRAQGANPEISRQHPSVAATAEWAISVGTQLLHPAVVWQDYDVENIHHDRVDLTEVSLPNFFHQIQSAWVVQRLKTVQKLYALICTIGPILENKVSEILLREPSKALALDGFGSAAVEWIAAEACEYIHNHAEAIGLSTTLPISPGDSEWSVEIGQPQIFSLLDSGEINVSLNPSAMMIPRKSISFIVGAGKNVDITGSVCDYCNLNSTCHYRNRP
jgi:hypothetical protein